MLTKKDVYKQSVTICIELGYFERGTRTSARILFNFQIKPFPGFYCGRSSHTSTDMSSPGSSSNEGMDDVPDFVEEEEEELEEMEEDEEGEDGYGSDDYIIESDHDTGYSSGEENNELKDQKEAFFAACKNGDIEAVKQCALSSFTM